MSAHLSWTGCLRFQGSSETKGAKQKSKKFSPDDGVLRQMTQKGIDVVVSVIAPDGVKLFEVDSPNGSAGEEPATIAAQQNGLYRIEIRSMEKNAATGRYAIRLDRFLTESEYQTERLASLGRLWGEIKYFHQIGRASGRERVSRSVVA